VAFNSLILALLLVSTPKVHSTLDGKQTKNVMGIIKSLLVWPQQIYVNALSVIINKKYIRLWQTLRIKLTCGIRNNKEV